LKPENLATSLDVAARSPRPHNMPAPRLLTAGKAAAYLGYGSPDVLRHIPISPVKLTGPSAQPRWDRKRLDDYLDSLSGFAASQEVAEPSAEVVFANWRAARAQ